MPETVKDPSSFFEKDEGGFRSTRRAVGPWNAQTLGGGPLAALMAHALQEHRGGESFRLLRLTMDFLRPVPAGRVDVRAGIRREGRRLRVIEGVISADNIPLCHASAVFCRGSTSAPAHLPEPTASTVPPPDQVSDRSRVGPPSYTTSMQVRPVVHPSTGQLALVWVRFPYQLLPEVDLAPCTRAALTADAVSGFAFMTSEGVTAMNNDLSLHLHREPRGDWLAIEVERRVMREGIGVAHASLHDGDGLVGDCMVSAIAVDRPISVSPRQP